MWSTNQKYKMFFYSAEYHPNYYTAVTSLGLILELQIKYSSEDVTQKYKQNIVNTQPPVAKFKLKHEYLQFKYCIQSVPDKIT